MEQLTQMIAKYSPEPEFLLLIIFLFSLGKSVIFISSLLPPASVTLMLGIVAGKPVLSDIHVWAAITLGALLGSVLSFHCGALFLPPGIAQKVADPISDPSAPGTNRTAEERHATAVYVTFFGGDALYRALGRRYHCTAAQAGLLRQRAVRRDLGHGFDVG